MSSDGIELRFLVRIPLIYNSFVRKIYDKKFFSISILASGLSSIHRRFITITLFYITPNSYKLMKFNRQKKL